MNLIFPLVQRRIKEPENINSEYKYANRIMIKFFPKEKTTPDDVRRLQNQFYTESRLYYEDQEIAQERLQ